MKKDVALTLALWRIFKYTDINAGCRLKERHVQKWDIFIE